MYRIKLLALSFPLMYSFQKGFLGQGFQKTTKNHSYNHDQREQYLSHHRPG